MSDLRIGGLDSSLLRPGGPGQKEPGDGFGAVMKEAIGKVNEIHGEAQKAVKELASGGDITQAVIAMEKADMSFQVMVEVRNRLIAAYEEIMRMQV